MKKRLVLLITLVVSLFIYSGKVEAGADDIYTFAIDDSANVTQDVLRNAMCTEETDSCQYVCKQENFTDYGEQSDFANCPYGVDKFYINYNSKKNELSSLKEKLKSRTCGNVNCYKYVTDTYCSKHEEDKVCIALKENKGSSPDNDECSFEIILQNSDKLNLKFNFSVKDKLTIHPAGDVSGIVANENEKITGQEDIIYFYNKGSNFASFEREIIEKYNSNGKKCPSIKFCRDQNKNGYAIWYTELDKCDSKIYSGNAEQTVDEDGMNSGIDYGHGGDSGKIDEGSDVETCGDLFGDELLDKINSYFGVIKLIVPILLIGFGIFDFSKAVFENEEGMKKARQKFIMRIVAAILFFLLPVFIKFILSLANNVWSFINPDTCIR